MSETNEQETHLEEAQQENVSQPVVELPGRRLREQRENRHLSLEEVAHHLHLDVQLISSLENDDYSNMPSPAYICGYLRSYARLLKLPEDEVVQAYSHGEQINAALIPSSVSIVPRKASKAGLVKAGLIILITLLIAVGLYLLADKYVFFSAESAKQGSKVTVPISPAAIQEKPEPATGADTVPAKDTVTPAKADSDTPKDTAKQAQVESVQTVVESLPTPKTIILKHDGAASETGKTAAVAPTVNNSHNGDTATNTTQLRLHTSEDSWVEVTDSTGQRLVYRMLEKDTDLQLDGTPPFAILLGNAAAVKVFYNGKEFDHSRYHRDQIAYFKVGAK